MRFRTLQFRLSAVVFAFGILLISIHFTRQYSRDVDAQRRDLRLSAYEEGSRLSGLAQHFLRRELPQSADLVVSYASVDPLLLHAVICDGHDLVRHATEQQWRGLNLKETPAAAAAPMLEKVRARMEGRIEESADGSRMLAVFPFWDVAHNRGKGAIILEYDLARVLLTARNRVLRESAAEACALFGGCLLLWALLHIMITERVGKIVEQTQNITWDSEPPAEITGPDELAHLSRSFTHAVRRLRATEQRFRNIASSMRDIFWVAPSDPLEPAYVNPAYESFWGRQGERLAGHRWEWLHSVAREDRRKILEMLRTLRREPGEVDLEVRIERPEGPQWMHCRSFSVLRTGDAPGALQVMGVMMDITERKRLEGQLIEVAEQERRRIGQDLHDDLCQRLAAAHLKTGVVQSVLARAGIPQTQLMSDLERELAEATDIARRFAKGLAPVAVGPEALPQALQDLGTFLDRAFGFTCTVVCHSLEGAVDDKTAVQIYRIAQELATNAAKHSGGTWIRISLEATPQGVHLLVRNDGLTFKPPTTSRDRGMGLRMVQQRADALDAALSFERLPNGTGTSVTCEIPFPTNT